MKPKTIAEIKANLETAAYVDRLLPPVRSPKYRCLMPEIIYTPQEIALMDRRPVRPRPTQAQVMPVGGFLTLGCVIAFFQWFNKKRELKKRKEAVK